MIGRDGAGKCRRRDWLEGVLRKKVSVASSRSTPPRRLRTGADVPWLMLPIITGWIEQ